MAACSNIPAPEVSAAEAPVPGLRICECVTTIWRPRKSAFGCTSAADHVVALPGNRAWPRVKWLETDVGEGRRSRVSAGVSQSGRQFTILLVNLHLVHKRQVVSPGFTL